MTGLTAKHNHPPCQYPYYFPMLRPAAAMTRDPIVEIPGSWM
jgi:hypothetical protein